MNIRETSEARERQFLSEYAQQVTETRGRERPEDKCEIRTDYQRDRDRVIHSKAFRRLKHKTQVFLAPRGDHYRTRLTHTLEVTQIARTIARALQLNEDLAEAVALGHDLGHTPFGHAGEDVLKAIAPGGFRHYEQSLRVVEHLEGGVGLNLTWEVRDGIVNHAGGNLAKTLEGQIVKFADRIAYINHDIDDAIRGGVITEEDLPSDCVSTLSESHAGRINTMIMALVSESVGRPCIVMRKDVLDAMMSLRDFMFENVYLNSAAKVEEKKVKNIVESLYNYFLENPHEMPNYSGQDEVSRIVCDYIAGMTDNYAIEKYNEIFVPKCWSVR